MKISEINKNPKNPRKIKGEQLNKLMESIQRDPEFMKLRPIVIDENNMILGGNQRYTAIKKLGMKEIPDEWIARAENLTEEQRKRFILVDNGPEGMTGEWDFDALQAEWELPELESLGFDIPDFEQQEDLEKEIDYIKLSDRFGVPPFSVINSNNGWWKDRKRFFIDLGIRSEEGRSAPAGGSPDLAARQNGNSGTSIFDPVLCELVYKWFSKKGDIIIDPFAGGSVRGIVCGILERKYKGMELRPEQVKANYEQIEILKDKDFCPEWICGDSLNIEKGIKEKGSLLFSCPPYADLEKYSDDKRDLSNMPYNEFMKNYSEIIKKCFNLLNQDSFAVFVVGEVRSKKGHYYNFVPDTIRCFLDAGFLFYNEMILLNSCGSAALRAANSFQKSRKICKVHQNILVFIKGDAKKATERLGNCEFGEIAEE